MCNVCYFHRSDHKFEEECIHPEVNFTDFIQRFREYLDQIEKTKGKSYKFEVLMEFFDFISKNSREFAAVCRSNCNFLRTFENKLNKDLLFRISDLGESAIREYEEAVKVPRDCISESRKYLERNGVSVDE
jgi:hypothetical protein